MPDPDHTKTHHTNRWQSNLLDEDTLALMIPIVAVLAVAIVGLVAVIFRHRERMAMIERGMHPDDLPGEVDPEEDPAFAPQGSAPTQAYDRHRPATTP